MQPVTIIGMGLSPQDLTAKHLEMIAAADILIGGRRLLEHFKDSTAEKKIIGKDLESIHQYIHRCMGHKSIVVLASGDPLFFGIGAYLVKKLGKEKVDIYPNISSVAAAFARVKEPWSNVRILSLHGKKNEKALFRALGPEDKVAVLTDPAKNPAWLSAMLSRKGVTDFQICVLESLGTPSERFQWYALDQAAKMKFSEPNVVILKRTQTAPVVGQRLHLGMPDDAYFNDHGLITKSEVRTVTLSKLCLSSQHVLWDLGAGSGSVAIEASLFIKKGEIFAVEKKPERIKLIEANKKRYRVRNLSLLQADLPQGLDKLSAPDRIFIGGGGKKLAKIVDAATGFLNPGGIIVVNTVLLSNVDSARKILAKKGFEVEVVQVQINRSKEMPWGQRMEAMNPVWIISGINYE